MTEAEPLTTGWEPDVAADDTVLRQFVHAYADRVVATATAAGGEVLRTDRAVAANARSAFFFDNAVVLLRPPGPDTVDDLAVAAALFGDRPWVLLSVWPTPDFREVGLTLVGHPPLMLRMPGGRAPAHPAHLMIRQVTDDRTLADFTGTLVSGYPMPAGVDTVAFHPDLLGTTVDLLVGYVDGQPVACGGAASAPGLVELDWIATLPAHRGKGYGAALTWAAATIRPGLPAVLLASDDGRPVYERLGFVPLLRCTMWMKESPA
jgi:GNAT superfamily N-acetyltransferase